jgi:hypothetical protein
LVDAYDLSIEAYTRFGAFENSSSIFGVGEKRSADNVS